MTYVAFLLLWFLTMFWVCKASRISVLSVNLLFQVSLYIKTITLRTQNVTILHWSPLHQKLLTTPTVNFFVTFDVPYWINCPHKGICGLWHLKQSVRSCANFFFSHNGMLFVSNPFLWFCVVWIQASLSQRKKLRVTHTGVNMSLKAIKKLILSTGCAGWKW